MIKTTYTNRKHQQGLTLVEIMVAVALSVILLTGVIEVFSSSKQTYRIQDNLARVQENGRFALDFLARDIRVAGYTGCKSFAAELATAPEKFTNTLNNDTDFAYNYTTGIEGYDDVGTAPTYLAAAGITPRAGTDVIIVRHASDDPVRLTKNNDTDTVYAELVSTETSACTDAGGNVSDKLSGICPGDILMVSDCVKARVFQAGAVTVSGTEVSITHPGSGSPGNAIASWGGNNSPLLERFDENAELARLGTYAYYIAPGLNGNPALFRVDEGTSMELVDNVEDMQITYGEDLDGDQTADVYRDAGNVINWNAVVAVRLHLLLHTNEDAMAGASSTYTFNGTSITAPDQRLRREFTTTITLRNRAS